jgi:hypothetical protein
MTPKLNHKTNILAITTAGVLATVGIAYAAIPSADGVIHGCYDANSPARGQLRVIDTDAGAKCSKTEKVLDFNQKGPKGDTGAAGAQGPGAARIHLTLPVARTPGGMAPETPLLNLGGLELFARCEQAGFLPTFAYVRGTSATAAHIDYANTDDNSGADDVDPSQVATSAGGATLVGGAAPARVFESPLRRAQIHGIYASANTTLSLDVVLSSTGGTCSFEGVATPASA